ncbi:hypothetical protein NL676_028564 [Syzygium grande]|nr:hypothetical protein NL676_028564 [Syzygium grande]
MTSRMRWWRSGLVAGVVTMAGTHGWRSVVAVMTQEAAEDPQRSRSSAEGRSDYCVERGWLNGGDGSHCRGRDSVVCCLTVNSLSLFLYFTRMIFMFSNHDVFELFTCED